MLDKVRIARTTLNFKKQPLLDAIKKYRQAQSLSLLDPMVSTEPQRMELLEVKRETALIVAAHTEKLQMLVEQLPKAKSNVYIAMEQHRFILREIDSLMRHRDAIRELVFVKNVAD